MSVCVMVDSATKVMHVDESFSDSSLCHYLLLTSDELAAGQWSFSQNEMFLVFSAALSLYGLSFIFRQVRYSMLNR